MESFSTTSIYFPMRELSYCSCNISLPHLIFQGETIRECGHVCHQLWRHTHTLLQACDYGYPTGPISKASRHYRYEAAQGVAANVVSSLERCARKYFPQKTDSRKTRKQRCNPAQLQSTLLRRAPKYQVINSSGYSHKPRSA